MRQFVTFVADRQGHYRCLDCGGTHSTTTEYLTRMVELSVKKNIPTLECGTCKREGFARFETADEEVNRNQ
jgi:transcription elongation factor Elf1